MSSVVISGDTSGAITVAAPSVAGSNTLTLPAATDTLVGKATTDTLTNKTITGLNLSAGSTSVAPITLASGTNLTTAAAGAMEYDGTVHYKTNNASNRGLSPAVQYAILNNTTYTLTSQTAAQALFNASATGAITLPTGFFEFECYYALTSMSSTSGSFGFALAGTATYTQAWTATALKNAAGSAGATAGTSYNTAANTTLVTANTTTTAWAYIKGTIRVSVAGTVIPQVSLGQAAAAIVSAGSYFKITQITNTTNQTIGNWS
jgi:hypothetical protein